MISRPLSIAILACAGLAAASQALALGFGRIPESIPFGQTLDVVVPLRLEAGESLTPACVQAEVHVGEQRLPPGALQVTLEPAARGHDEWRVRLRSAVAVQEPLVAVNLALGCNGSVSRQFVVFADPPSTRADTPRAIPAEPAAPTPVAVPAETVPRPTARKPARRAQADGARARIPVRSSNSAVAARGPVPKSTTPRLKLEEPEALLKAATLAVAAQDAALASAAQAASAAEAAASAAEQRLGVMEASLKSMRADAAAHGTSMELMRQRLAQAEDQGRTQSVLAAAVAALLLLVLWLGWRVRALQRERQSAWWQGSAAAEAAAAPPMQGAAPAAAEPVVARPNSRRIRPKRSAPRSCRRQRWWKSL